MYIVYHIPIQCKSASTCWCMLQRFGCVFFQDSVLPFCSHCEFRLISKTDSILNTSFGRIPPLQPSANCWIVNLEPSCINKWMAGRMDWWCICPCLFQLLAPKSCMYIYIVPITPQIPNRTIVNNSWFEVAYPLPINVKLGLWNISKYKHIS